MHLLPPFRRRPETSQIFPGDHSGGWGHSVGRGMFLQVPTSSMGVNLVRNLFGSRANAKQPLPDAEVASECLLGASCANRRLSFLKRCKRVDGTQSLVVSEQAVRVLVLSWAWSMIWSTISGGIVIVVAVAVFVGERGGSGNRRKNKEGRWPFISENCCARKPRLPLVLSCSYIVQDRGRAERAHPNDC